MIDRYGRPLEDLRITLTHVCNFSCFFCHMEGEGLEQSEVLSPEQIGLVSEVGREFGINSVKLTGGEPTLRRDLINVIRAIKEADVREISMTTNGFLLDRLAVKLKEAGLNRVNISLHAMEEDKFKEITGVDGLRRVIEGIRAAVSAGLRPVKMNFVLTKKNTDQVEKIISFAESVGVDELHLIELHPVGLGKQSFSTHEWLDSIERKLFETSNKIEIREKHFRPRYVLPSGLVVEVVKPYANPIFCAGCNRVRLTVDGKLKTCLYRDDKVVDVRNVLTSSLPLWEKRELLRRAYEIVIAIREPNFKFLSRPLEIR
ncbi:putative molybdenum cofactor biosynthesis protein A, archaeal [Metallosphaera yellowstonensis MK1]|jgi:cyclic pyranopterin phosphate synthase|uniref:Probable GTP 3',8-cyclase n=1 Tax=Metallosphaera yellowstonensis MK1 TaxID=671065 RepID=H2C822_9CREN|nr:GTP 3',8-cyclase MoaA [Metallosphaera yellowstonensis]EHP68298.1 putative molybdenum cofactor biosynthesis protein A, archaeal [Metallosphaera yellowstonensis MK1]